MNKTQANMMGDFVKFIIILLVVIISLSSFCKRKPEDNEIYLEPINVSNNAGRSENPSIAVDSRNTVHLVWNDDTPGNEEIFYAYKPANGNWSTPVNISNNLQPSRFPCIAIDKNDVIYLVWQDCSPDGYWRIFYSQKSVNGTWTMPDTITGEYMYVVPKIAVDDSGNVHLIWKYGGYYSGIRYIKRSQEGIWSNQMSIINPIAILNHNLIIDNQRNVFVSWYYFNFDSSIGNIFYSMKPENGNWTQPENISNTGKATGPNTIIADKQGDIHFAWNDDTRPYLTPKILYREKRSNGTWTNPVAPCTLYKVWLTCELAIGPQNELYIAGGDSIRLLYLVKPLGQAFSDTIVIGIVNHLFGLWKLICDNSGSLHFVWERGGDIFWISYKPSHWR